MKFTGILVKPLDEQHDRDDPRIDPVGLRFDPDETYTIWREFSYRVPEDVLGRGKLSRAPDGSIVMEGELLPEVASWLAKTPLKLGVAGVTGRTVWRQDHEVVLAMDIVSVGLLREHNDPDQPSINVQEETP